MVHTAYCKRSGQVEQTLRQDQRSYTRRWGHLNFVATLRYQRAMAGVRYVMTELRGDHVGFIGLRLFVDPRLNGFEPKNGS